MRHAYDENEAVAREENAVSGDSFDPSDSSSSSVNQHRAQRNEADYGNNMPTRPAYYISDEDTSSESGNKYENLAND